MSHVEISDGKATLRLEPENLRAFQDWERLGAEEKEALLWIAKEHPTVMAIVRAYKALGWFGAALTRVGILAGALTGIGAALRLFGVI